MKHPAIIKAEKLVCSSFTKPLTRDERLFTMRVDTILQAERNNKAFAESMFGEGSGAWQASLDLSERQRDHDLKVALEWFEKQNREVANAV